MSDPRPPAEARRGSCSRCGSADHHAPYGFDGCLGPAAPPRQACGCPPIAHRQRHLHPEACAAVDASLLSASPAGETPRPGEGDLRGEVHRLTGEVLYVTWMYDGTVPRLTRERDAAVERATLAEQKAARVEALIDRERDFIAGNERVLPRRTVTIADLRDALADPEADR